MSNSSIGGLKSYIIVIYDLQTYLTFNQIWVVVNEQCTWQSFHDSPYDYGAQALHQVTLSVTLNQAWPSYEH